MSENRRYCSDCGYPLGTDACSHWDITPNRFKSRSYDALEKENASLRAEVERYRELFAFHNEGPVKSFYVYGVDDYWRWQAEWQPWAEEYPDPTRLGGGDLIDCMEATMKAAREALGDE